MEAVKNLIRTRNVVFLTGAGISTDSNIPDYRGANGVYKKNPSYRPIQYQEFMKSTKEFRQRYWARSMLGFPTMGNALPNSSHQAIQSLLELNPDNALITQNVDGLHAKAGSVSGVEMHGTLHMIECQKCKTDFDRSEFQQILNELNPKFHEWALANPKKLDFDVSSSLNPDGDAEVTWDYSEFQFPDCFHCKHGILKPKVVFFGENIRQHVRDKTFELVDNADVLCVVASSLTVYSSLRLVKKAAEAKKDIIILNQGDTRGDSLATFKLDHKCKDVLLDWTS